MLRWMLSPNDSWQTPICSDRKRDSPPILRGDHLVDRRTAGPAAGERRARHQAAHRAVVLVARPGHAGRRIIEAADHVDVVAERRQRRRHGVIS